MKKKTKYTVIVIFIGMLVLVSNGIVPADLEVQPLEIKYGYKLVLDNGRYILRSKRGAINLYGSKGHILKHFPRDTKINKNAMGVVFIVSKEKAISIGNFKDMIKY